MLNDLRIALRGLRRSPGTAAVAVLVIGLGIGANAVVFSLLDAFLFRPLDLAAPERLVRLYGTQAAAGRERQNVTQATFFEWRRRAAGPGPSGPPAGRSVRARPAAGSGGCCAAAWW